MDVALRKHGEATILDIEGSLDTTTAPYLHEVLTRQFDSSTTILILDFSRLGYISSAGLRVLLAAGRRASAAGGLLRVCHLNDTVQDVFDITGFATVIPVFDTVDDAVAGLER